MTEVTFIRYDNRDGAASFIQEAKNILAKKNSKAPVQVFNESLDYPNASNFQMPSYFSTDAQQRGKYF